MEPVRKMIPLVRHPYVVLVGIGMGLLVFSLFFRLRGQPSVFLELQAIGILLVAIGEAINYPRREIPPLTDAIQPAHGRGYPSKRDPSILGNLIEICGVLSLFIGVSYLL